MDVINLAAELRNVLVDGSKEDKDIVLEGAEKLEALDWMARRLTVMMREICDDMSFHYHYTPNGAHHRCESCNEEPEHGKIEHKSYCLFQVAYRIIGETKDTLDK